MKGHEPRMLVLGLDGLDWALLEPMLESGVMPHLARLRREGAWGPLRSVVPTQSAAAWASFVTGQNPARHGVLDFFVRQADGSYRHARPDPAATLWHHLGSGGLRVGVLNFPVTYPPDPVNGFMVSGMLSPTGKTFTHPAALGRDLLAQLPGYRLDVEWQLYNNREEALVRDLVEMTRERASAAHYLRDRFAPDCLAVAFIGPDRLQHALWRHLDPTHPRHDPRRARALTGAIHGFYHTLDEAIGQLVAGAGADATVVILSDHGFQAAAWQFRVDDWLAGQGWLAWQPGRSRTTRLLRRFDTPRVQRLRRRLVKDISRHLTAFAPGGTVDWSRTVAFCPWNVQQGVRINVRGRDPHGLVAPGAEYESLRDEIRAALTELTVPHTALPVVSAVWNREEIYDGPYLEAMPDLVLALQPRFAASPVQQQLWSPTGWASGDHSLTGMVLLWGSAVAPGRIEGSHLVDVMPTALYLSGQPLPASIDGQVLAGAVDPAFLAAHPVRYREQADRASEPGVPSEVMTPEEVAEVQARLRGLGYLG